MVSGSLPHCIPVMVSYSFWVTGPILPSAGKRVLDVDRRDGVKLLLEGDAWVMMRPSGTEPLVRIYAEAATTDEVNELLDAAEAVVTSL